MRILVIDDKQIHRDAAVAQLKDHDLTVVGTYDEGLEAIERRISWTVVNDECEKRGIKYRSKDGSPEWRLYKETHDRITEELRAKPFDAVLVDLQLPASSREQNKGYKFVGQEMPIGIFLALLAAKHGAKYVALLTDTNHHDHPASACLDAFNKDENHPTPFMVGEATVLLTNNRLWSIAKPDLTGFAAWDEYYKAGETVSAKNWQGLLDYVMNSKEGSDK